MEINDGLKMMEAEYIESDIRGLAPKDRLAFWASLKEFQRAKVMRMPYEPMVEEDVKIVIADQRPDDLSVEDLERLIVARKNERNGR